MLAVIPASDFVNALSSSGQMKDLLQAVDFNYALKLPAVQAAIRNLSFSKVLDAIDIQKIKTDYIPDLINVTLGNVEYATLNGETLYCNYKVRSFVPFFAHCPALTSWLTWVATVSFPRWFWKCPCAERLIPSDSRFVFPGTPKS